MIRLISIHARLPSFCVEIRRHSIARIQRQNSLGPKDPSLSDFDFDVVFGDPNYKALRALSGRWTQDRTGFDVEPGTMPWADDLVACHHALCQRPAAVRARILDGIIAREPGLARTKELPWSEPELEILERYACMSDERIRLKLKAAGYVQLAGSPAAALGDSPPGQCSSRLQSGR